MREARKIANDYIARNVPYMGDRREDLVSFLVLKALESVGRFDASRATTTYGQNGGRHFDSWICDIMEHRCIDWYRSKAEGNGDRRYQNDNRLVLSPMDEDPDPDVDFDNLVSEKRLARWQSAAEATGWTFRDWVCITLDSAAAQIERAAA